ncbi:carbohydrate sulfotransferase 5 [Cricetulus griseus]|uniref:Sulfotransferase n=1 Tax=Cricetulus griseus TaxID=10029 RepID=A0A061I1G1_CRIGR|nr:carbohydrate sulfotransferase 5 [Cricetulus griseus]
MDPRTPYRPPSAGVGAVPAAAAGAVGAAASPGNGTRGTRGGGDKRQLVYVFTTWRSGSSFFGELFNQNPEVFFLYEPVWHVWQKLYPGDAVSLQGAARDMLSALYRCDLSVFQLYSPAGSGGRNLTTLGIFGAATNKVVCSSPLCPAYRKEVVGLVDDRVCKKCPPQRLARFEEECRKYRTLVIKGVRVFDVAVLAPLLRDPALDLKVIHLVRDPRAVARSRIRSRHGLIRESLQVVRSRDPRAHRMPFLEAAGHKLGAKKEGIGGPADYHALGAMEVICNSMAKTLQTALQPPDWLQGHYLVVRYEDLVGDPVKTLRRVYDFVGLLVPNLLKPIHIINPAPRCRNVFLFPSLLCHTVHGSAGMFHFKLESLADALNVKNDGVPGTMQNVLQVGSIRVHMTGAMMGLIWQKGAQVQDPVSRKRKRDIILERSSFGAWLPKEGQGFRKITVVMEEISEREVVSGRGYGLWIVLEVGDQAMRQEKKI